MAGDMRVPPRGRLDTGARITKERFGGNLNFLVRCLYSYIIEN
jgi:hypothetical protein